MQADFHSVFSVEDLLADARQVADAILQSCKRRPAKRPIALCQLDGRFVVTLRATSQPPTDLQFVTMENPDLEAILAVFHDRWKGGYDPVGMVTDRNEAGELQSFLLLQK